MEENVVNQEVQADEEDLKLYQAGEIDEEV